MITELLSTDEKHEGHNKPAICHVGSEEIVKLEAVMERGKQWHGGELVAQDSMGNERKEKSIIIKTIIEPPAIPDFNFDDTKTIYKNIPETESIINP